MKNKNIDTVLENAEIETDAAKSENKPDIEAKIYNALNTAEKIAIKLVQIRLILRKAAKKKKKKLKKLGKIDKKTGTLILKGQKKQKAAKKHKKYKPAKKK